MALSPAQKEAFARANSSTVVLWNLELRHPIWPSPIRVTQSADGNNTETITFPIEAGAPIDGGTDQVFQALAMELKPPSVGTDPDTSLSVQADGVSGEVQPLISAANRSSVAIEVAVRAYAYNVVLGEVGDQLSVYYLQMRDANFTNTTVQMSIGYSNGANMSFPSIKYTTQTNPGLS